MSKLFNIYKFFCLFSKSEVDCMLNKLSCEEKSLFGILFEDDSMDSIKYSLEQRQLFYTLVLPKMMYLLNNPDKKYIANIDNLQRVRN